MIDERVSTGQRSLGTALLRSPVLWIAAVVCVIASPALFLSTLVVGLVVTVVGLVLRRRAGVRVWPLALGIGMILGSLPYSIAALVAALG